MGKPQFARPCDISAPTSESGPLIGAEPQESSGKPSFLVLCKYGSGSGFHVQIRAKLMKFDANWRFFVWCETGQFPVSSGIRINKNLRTIS
jgi:hypothetical protein